ncbi:hypothetical protein ACOMHN_058481 [Nucella lapillus]
MLNPRPAQLWPSRVQLVVKVELWAGSRTPRVTHPLDPCHLSIRSCDTSTWPLSFEHHGPVNDIVYHGPVHDLVHHGGFGGYAFTFQGIEVQAELKAVALWTLLG